MERFAVHSISGYNMSGKRLTTTHSVLDGACCFREVASFKPSGAVHRITARKRADDLCAALNAEHDAWAREHGYPAAV